MKLIIAGSRNLQVYTSFTHGIISSINYPIIVVDEIVSGTARGIDSCGEHYAQSYNLKLTKFPADWDKYGKKAGMIRNQEMANYADALLLIWDGESRGSANMLYQMKQLGKPVYEVIMRKHNV